MIEIKNISKKYGKDIILQDLSLTIPKNSIFGFLGPNGAGKTTTIKMLAGLNAPDTGSILIEKKPISDIKIKEKTGFMPEDPYFYDHLTAYEFMSYMQNLFSKKTENLNKILKLVGLEKSANQKIGQFSKGMKQRLGLAQAIVNNPDYLFLDEPLDGLDPIGRKEFKEIYQNLKNKGKTIFFNSHVLSDVEELCDQIGVIHQGNLIYSGNVKKFCGKKTLEEAFVNKLSNL